MTGPELSEIRSVVVADVYKAGYLAARLRRTNAGVEFAYLPEYVASGRPPVATTLGFDVDGLVTPAGAVPPFFAGLLPEGRRLSSLRRAVKTSADDELSLLLAVGRDPVGDVQLVPEGLVPSPAEPLVSVEHSFKEVSFSDLLAEPGMVDPVAIPGVQDKVSARMISVPVGRATDRWILKIDPPDYPHVVENYDLPSTVFYNDRTLALPLTGKRQGISRKRLLDFAVAIGLPEKTALRVLDQVLSGTANLCAELEQGRLPFKGKVLADTVSELRYRRRQLTG